MRFAVISDIHGNLAALESVLADIEALDPGVDRTVCAGDIVGHGAHPNEVIALLRSRDIDSVLGNYDDAVAGERVSTGADYATESAREVDYAAVRWTRQQLSPDSISYLQGLPREMRLFMSASGRTAVRAGKHDDATQEFRKSFFFGSMFRGGTGRRMRARRVLLVHGSPRDTAEYIYPQTGKSILEVIAREAQAEVIIFGHTHISFHRVVGGTAFIGVGSVGRARAAQGTAEYAVVEVVGPEIEVEFRDVDYTVEAEARAIEGSGLPRSLADQLRSGWPA